MRLVPLTTLNNQSAITQVTTTGTLTSGSAVVTGIPSTAAIVGALGISGTGIPSGTYVYSIDSATQVTLSQNATANGSQSLTFTLEPVSLAEAKKHARIEYPDDDALVAGLITSARRYAETALKSALLKQQWILFSDSFPVAGGYYNPAVRQVWVSNGGMPSGLMPMPGFTPNSTGTIDIPLPPLISVDSIQYENTAGILTTIDPSLYIVSTGSFVGRVQPPYSKVWPLARPTIDAVQITFTCGQGPTADKIDENVKAAIKMAVAHWYANREWVQPGAMLTVPNTVDALLCASDPGIYA